MSGPCKGYADLASLPEDARIQIIAQCVVEKQMTVGVALEDEAKKITRYERKLNAARPGLLKIEKLPGLVRNTVTLRVSPMPQNAAEN